MAEDTAMTLEDVAKRLHVSERTVVRLVVERKELKGYKVGRSWRFEPSDVEDYIERQRRKSDEQQTDKRPAVNVVPPLFSLRQKGNTS